MSLRIARFKKKSEDWVTSHVQKFISKQSGHEITLKIDWDSFGDLEDNEDFFKRGLNHTMLEGNVRSLCRDELGKEAFKSTIKDILMQHTDLEDPDEMGYGLKDGTLIFTTNQKKRIYGSMKPMEGKLEKLF